MLTVQSLYLGSAAMLGGDEADLFADYCNSGEEEYLRLYVRGYGKHEGETATVKLSMSELLVFAQGGVEKCEVSFK